MAIICQTTDPGSVKKKASLATIPQLYSRGSDNKKNVNSITQRVQARERDRENVEISRNIKNLEKRHMCLDS